MFAGTDANARGKSKWRPGLDLATKGATDDRGEQFLPADVFVFHTGGNPDAELIASDLAEDIARAGKNVDRKGHPPVAITCKDPLRLASLRDPVREAVELIVRNKGSRALEIMISTTAGHPAQVAALLEAVDALPVAISLALLHPANPSKHRYVRLRADDTECLSTLVERYRHLPPEQVLLIQGPSGAGKSHLARALHSAWRTEAKAPDLVEVNCGAFPDALIEAELFGHDVGTFTGANSDRKGCFERAAGSSLFLDEIGELPVDHQVRLLKALEPHRDALGSHWAITRMGASGPRKVRARIILGTNRDLLQQCVSGAFRVDLYGRIAAHTIQLPALKDLRHVLLPRLMDELDQALADCASAAGRKGNLAAGWDRAARQAVVELLVDGSTPWTWNHRDIQHLAQRLAFRAWVNFVSDPRSKAKPSEAAKSRPFRPQVTQTLVDAEARALRTRWAAVAPEQAADELREALADGELERLSPSERLMAQAVLKACQSSRSKVDAWARLVEGGHVRAAAGKSNPSTALHRQLKAFKWRRPLF
jgi:DNA-binding NtrC family response regulator